MSKKIEGVKTKVFEFSRIYTFPGGDKINIQDVRELIVRPSGTHRLKDAYGHLHILPVGWIHIEINSPKSWVK